MKRNSVTEQARAKINLSLDVTGRLDDGYHLVRMIMETVELGDTLTITAREDGQAALRITGADLPGGPDNLAYRAAVLMMDTYGCGGADILLEKRIPVAAGLAGGSADAAAVLLGMNRLYGLGRTADELAVLGRKLGADVPYCVKRGTMLAEGTGEKLTPLPPAPPCRVLLVKPDIEVSTKYVYEHLSVEQRTDHPDVDAAIRALEKGSLQDLAGCMGNLLEQVTGEICPVIGEIENVMEEAGALRTMMSGSGPTVFGLFEGQEAMEKAAALCRKMWPDAVVEKTRLYKV